MKKSSWTYFRKYLQRRYGPLKIDFKNRFPFIISGNLVDDIWFTIKANFVLAQQDLEPEREEAFSVTRDFVICSKKSENEIM